MTDQPKIQPNHNAGKVVHCSRCAGRCIVAPTRNENARLMRHGNETGWCAMCGITNFLQNCAVVSELLKQQGAECLRLPHVQAQMARVLLAGGSDIRPEQIDWDEVIANWNLPFDKPKNKKD